MIEQSVITVYDTLSSAEEAIRKLDRGGFPIKQVSIVSQNLQSEREVHGYVIAGDVAKGGAGVRTWTGGLFNQLPGAAFIWVPGFGPLVAAGLLAAGLLRSIEAGVGISADAGLLHVLAGWGVPLKRIIKYAEALKAGKYLVIAHGNAAEGAKAWDTLQDTGADNLHLHYRKMGLARFVAQDPYTPAMTEKEMEELIPRIRGAMDWTIHPNGEVTLEYDRVQNSDDIIEAALAGMGFKLKHIFDHPDANQTEMRAALGEIERPQDK